MRKAFYSVLPEEVLGPLLCADERASLLRAVGFNDQQINDLCMESWSHRAAPSLKLVFQRTSFSALNEWHMMAWSTVEDQELYQVHSLGVKPGVSVADLILACCFARFHKHLAFELEEARLGSL